MKRLLKGILLGAALVIGGMTIANAQTRTEQPAYDSMMREGAFELRDYAPYTVAEVTRYGSRREASSAAFWPLANYIFAKEREGEKIAMTAPVTTSPQNMNGEWVVRFSMPSKYTLETLPRPANSEVRLLEVPAHRMAAVIFSGYMTDSTIAKHEGQLLAWMQSKGLKPAGLPTYAGYNRPGIPGFMRRNEVMVPVE